MPRGSLIAHCNPCMEADGINPKYLTEHPEEATTKYAMRIVDQRNVLGTKRGTTKMAFKCDRCGNVSEILLEAAEPESWDR
jgi:hypothetical protein